MGLYLGKAESVISELSNSLNSEEGGNISKSLESLYNFILKELLLANIKKDPVVLEKLTSILSKLREAWHQIYTKEEVKIASPEEVRESITYHS
jgi:flagellar protein FliS